MLEKLKKIAEDYKEKLILAKVNLERASLIAQKYGIDRVPAVFLFKEGRLISGFFGFRSEHFIREWLDKNL